MKVWLFHKNFNSNFCNIYAKQIIFSSFFNRGKTEQNLKEKKRQEKGTTWIVNEGGSRGEKKINDQKKTKNIERKK